MDWKDIGSLSGLAGALTADHIVETAIAIDAVRSAESDQALLRFHGFNAPGLITTPFMAQVGVCARDAGCVAFNGLERSFLPPKDSWIHPTLSAREYKVHLERDRLVSAKTWPFKQDGAMGDFCVNIAPKWWSHGLVHAMTGFAYWPTMSEWDVMLMARVGEVVASLHWYWLAELGRVYCPMHSVASGDSTPDCEACQRLEAEAAFPEVRLARLQDEGARYLRELESAKRAYQQALDEYDRLQLGTRNDQSSANVASRATPPLNPSSPKTVVNLILALILGGGLAVTDCFVIELLNRRVRCRDDVERDLDLPVLAELNPAGARRRLIF